jgi:hypothetical protein
MMVGQWGRGWRDLKELAYPWRAISGSCGRTFLLLLARHVLATCNWKLVGVFEMTGASLRRQEHCMSWLLDTSEQLKCLLACICTHKNKSQHIAIHIPFTDQVETSNAIRKAIDNGKSHGIIGAAQQRSNCGEKRFASEERDTQQLLQQRRPRKGVSSRLCAFRSRQRDGR